MLCPELAPPGPRQTFKEKIRALAGLGETLALFVLVMGGLFSGFFTPTEAGGVGAFGTLVIALIRRKIDRQGLQGRVQRNHAHLVHDYDDRCRGHYFRSFSGGVPDSVRCCGLDSGS